MTLLKTKEAAHQLAVSETTVRRWVSTFPASFRKDMFGHYIFDAPAMDKLRQIKGQLDSGTALYDIRLLSLAEEEALAAVAAEVMGTNGAVDTAADGSAGQSDDSVKLVVDEAGNVHAPGSTGVGRGGGAGALVVDSAGNVHAAGGSIVVKGTAGISRGGAGALVVDSAGIVHAAGGNAVSGEAGAKASAEITAGYQHAAAAADVAGARPVNLLPVGPAVQSQDVSQAIVPSAPFRPSTSLIDEPDPMLERLNAIENALSQKADEVVTVQLLHHRKELEELRKSLTELAATIEALRTPQQELAAFGKASPSHEEDGKRKKRGFRSFFFF
ncbi:MerR HTH family regulatory protein [Paenibacillus catalpae]|uniref:MerR HTH family regulatory protein n=1 Tax=Paenibacillus catalpae TaxID=1045775 RepID=A0A1I2DZM4_9BACL|nr:MerR HTH family regulatory protein [Paenibacillus catalpae]